MNACDSTKVNALERRLQQMESAVVAFSGGVDSSVLLAMAERVLPGRLLAATASSASFPMADGEAVVRFCVERGIEHRFVQTHEFEDPSFTANPADRCYHCKRHLYAAFVAEADRRGYRYVIEGTNASDLLGHRPGNRASRENERIATPLIDAGLTKADVRVLARELGLPTADKPAAACLASRVPTGEPITEALLRRIDCAEDVVRSCGIRQVRVRHQGDTARIEVGRDELGICIERCAEIVAKVREEGWRYVTLDLEGYRPSEPYTRNA